MLNPVPNARTAKPSARSGIPSPLVWWGVPPTVPRVRAAPGQGAARKSEGASYPLASVLLTEITFGVVRGSRDAGPGDGMLDRRSTRHPDAPCSYECWKQRGGGCSPRRVPLLDAGADEHERVGVVVEPGCGAGALAEACSRARRASSTSRHADAAGLRGRRRPSSRAARTQSTWPPRCEPRSHAGNGLSVTVWRECRLRGSASGRRLSGGTRSVERQNAASASRSFGRTWRWRRLIRPRL